ncbi:MAG: radical SAM protein [Proteobacteria bacterium]|nr:radical SAM protein [Pseudomonadota bacterium]
MCIFCNQDKIAGKHRGIPSSSEIKKTVRDYLTSWQGKGQKEIAFYGGSFTAIDTALQERLLQDVEPFIDSGQIDSVRISTRPDFISEDILTILKKYRVRTIELGIQSMHDEVLDASNRGHTVSHNISACNLIKKRGFSLGCQLMPGLPLDSDEKSLTGVYKISDLSPDFVRIYPTLVVKGTELESLYHKGEYHPLSLTQAIERCGKMVQYFRQKGIDVIRVGLQATKELEASIIAGPYHPAFGEMVESQIFFELAKDELNKRSFREERITFGLAPKDESAFRGRQNENMKKLKSLYPGLDFNVLKLENLLRGSLLVN